MYLNLNPSGFACIRALTVLALVAAFMGIGLLSCPALAQDVKKVPGEIQINFYRLMEVLPEYQQFRCIDTSTKEKILFSSHSFMGSMYVKRVEKDRVVFDSFEWMVPVKKAAEAMEDAEVYSEAGRELEAELGISLNDIAAPGEEEFEVQDEADEEYSDEPVEGEQEGPAPPAPGEQPGPPAGGARPGPNAEDPMNGPTGPGMGPDFKNMKGGMGSEGVPDEATREKMRAEMEKRMGNQP